MDISSKQLSRLVFFGYLFDQRSARHDVEHRVSLKCFSSLLLRIDKQRGNPCAAARAVPCEPERSFFPIPRLSLRSGSRRFSDYRFHSVRSLADGDLHFTSRGALRKSEPQSEFMTLNVEHRMASRFTQRRWLLIDPTADPFPLGSGFIEPSETMASVDGFRPINHLFFQTSLHAHVRSDRDQSRKSNVLRHFFTRERWLQPSRTPRLLSRRANLHFNWKTFVFAFLMILSFECITGRAYWLAWERSVNNEGGKDVFHLLDTRLGGCAVVFDDLHKFKVSLNASWCGVS